MKKMKPLRKFSDAMHLEHLLRGERSRGISKEADTQALTKD